MTPHPDHVSASLNFAGFLCGLAAYGMLLVLSLRAPVRVAAPAPDRLMIATGVLGLVWNLGAILVYGLDDLGLGPAPWPLGALAFTTLGGLPAVVVHSVLRAQPRDVPGGQARGLVIAAYGLSALAGFIHFSHRARPVRAAPPGDR